MLSGIYQIVKKATKLLHQQKQQSLEDYEKKLSMLSAHECYEFYMKIALEAFQYEAETGSIIALDWALKLVKNFKDYLKDWNQQYVILVDIGFTMYNYARDTNHRYAIPDAEQYQLFELFDYYNELVHKIEAKIDAEENQWHLECLSDAVYIAIITSTTLALNKEHRLIAVRKSSNVLQYRNNANLRCPTILMGLHLYLAGKLHYLNNKIDSAMDCYFHAAECLKCTKDVKGSMSVSYFYDAIYGKS